MSRSLTAATTLDNLKKEAKRWLKALRADDEQARARFGRAHPEAPARPGLLEVQHALALEHGLSSWAVLKAKLADDVGNATLEAAVTALLDAANRGDASSLTDLLNMYPDIVNERGVLPGHSGLRTALHFAINGSDETAVACLLGRGADPNIRCEGDNAMPLHFAAEKEHLRDRPAEGRSLAAGSRVHPADVGGRQKLRAHRERVEATWSSLTVPQRIERRARKGRKGRQHFTFLQDATLQGLRHSDP